MSEKTVATTITLTSVNHVSEEEQDELFEKYPEADDLSDVADQLGESVKALLAKRVFGDADEIPILDVNTDVYEDWGGASSMEE